jgi:hypothetical protein
MFAASSPPGSYEVKLHCPNMQALEAQLEALVNAASVQHELQQRSHPPRLRPPEIQTHRYPRLEPTLESDADWQAMNCVFDNGVRILSHSRGQKVRGLFRGIAEAIANDALLADKIVCNLMNYDRIHSQQKNCPQRIPAVLLCLPRLMPWASARSRT